MGYRKQPSRTLTALVTATCMLLLLGTVPCSAADDPIIVEHDLDEVELPPGDTAKVKFRVTNKGTEELGVAFEFIPVDAPRHSLGSFSTIYVLMSPGSVQDSTLTVSSLADRRDDPDVSGFVVRVSWGANLSVDAEMRPEEGTVDGQWEREFPVTFDASPDLGPWPYVLVMGLILLITAVIFYPAWRDRGAGRAGD